MKLAIVGCGPRGLAALERLIYNFGKRIPKEKLQILLFDDVPYPGAGQVWDPEQTDANWINISLRALEDLPGREPLSTLGINVPSFPKFTLWLADQHGVITSDEEDKFPARKKMGQYLNERFQSIYTVLSKAGIAKLYKCKIADIAIGDDSIKLKTDQGEIHTADDCLLSVGHQATKLDEQMTSWKEWSSDHNVKLFVHPYHPGIKSSIIPSDVVAIRGFGLSTVDIVRMLTLDRGGSFSQCKDKGKLLYHSGDTTPQMFVPFSLDGLPPVAKPLNRAIDNIYTPTDEAVIHFEKSLRDSLDEGKSPDSADFLIDTFSETFIQHFDGHFGLSQSSLQSLVVSWLNDQNTTHDLIIDKEQSTVDYLHTSIKAASGEDDQYVDYAIGQVWRHLQPSLYKIISHSGLPQEVMEEVIKLDESTKRYSYGPPVESMKQMVALIEAKLLNVDFVNDPEISLDDQGWKLTSDGEHVHCNTMIDSVLSPPKIALIKSGLLYELVHDEEVALVSDDLGIATSDTGVLQYESDRMIKNVALLGRNAKGTVMGVDAILECFGDRVDQWAMGLVERKYKHDL